MMSRFIDFYEMFAGLHNFFVTLLTILIPKKEMKV